ncbi:hypothetical protein TNCV_1625271 [Trichonephila clavipes]|nr:hypothetical protein TNCV_1625271 [Trichonephila clavipes]
MHRAIGAQRARDQMGRDRQGWPKNKRSKKELGGEIRELYLSLRSKADFGTVEIAKSMADLDPANSSRLGVELPRVNPLFTLYV